MSWLQPMAWLGLVAIALPVLIHLLGLGRARRLPFPTLRFLQTTRLLPTRRTTLHDPWLLLVRALIVLVAVAALAQPWWQTSARRTAYGRSLARVIVLDTSRSAQRAATRSGWSADSARAIATQLLNEADVGLLLETVQPELALAGATEWLRLQEQRQELVVVSDFQRGTMSDVVWTAIPADMGVRVLRIGTIETAAPSAVTLRSANGDVRVRATLEGDSAQHRTQATWQRTALRAADSSVAGATRVSLLASDSDSALANEVQLTTLDLRTQLIDSAEILSTQAQLGAARPEVTVVAAGYVSRSSLMDSVHNVKAPWMMDVVAQVSANMLLAEVAADAAPKDFSAGSGAGSEDTNASRIPVIRNDSGRVIVSAAAISNSQSERLFFFSEMALEHPTTTALLTAAQQALDATLNTMLPDIAEFETRAVSDSALARWQREPSANLSAAPTRRTSPLEGPSDARWLWLVVLMLFAVETVVRRRMQQESARSADPSAPQSGDTVVSAALRT